MVICTPAFTAEMDVGWVHPWVGSGWLGSTAVTALRISPSRRAHSSKPTARRGCDARRERQTDGQTDTVSLHRSCRILSEQFE